MHLSRTYKLFNLFLSVTGIIFLITYPSICIKAAKNGLTTALYIALPSLFPFIVLSKFIISGNYHNAFTKIFGKSFEKIFGITKHATTVFILGCVGGYPIGAVVLNDMLSKKEISKKGAEHLLGFCNNCGPMFIIGTVGTLMLGNTFYGYILYVIHIVSAILCGIIFKYVFKPENTLYSTKFYVSSKNSSFTSAVTSAAITMLNIASYIIFFSVIAEFVITVLGNLEKSAIAPILCFLEITNGINFASNCHYPEVFKISLISASLGFSGLCVFAQTKSVFENNPISFKKYFLAKVIISVLSFFVSYITFTIIFSN